MEKGQGRRVGKFISPVCPLDQQDALLFDPWTVSGGAGRLRVGIYFGANLVGDSALTLHTSPPPRPTGVGQGESGWEREAGLLGDRYFSFFSSFVSIYFISFKFMSYYIYIIYNIYI